MKLENSDFYSSQSDERSQLIGQDIDDNTRGTNDDATDVHRNMTPASIALVSYGVYKATEIPAVKEVINDCKESIAEKLSDFKGTTEEILETIGKNIDEFTAGIYDSVKEFFSSTKDSDEHDSRLLSKEFSETRGFGIDHCVEAACDLFNGGVISEWMNLTYDERAQICYLYADKVAEAFELENYKGVIFEQLEQGTLGYNCGDGYIHLTLDLLSPYNTPLNLIDTITHELRHQYQSECVNGYHDVSDEVRKEWAVASDIYTTGDAWCYDPWGYEYNPLEIDSRYAGQTVVRELTSRLINQTNQIA